MTKLTNEEVFERFGISPKDEASGVKDYPNKKEIWIINDKPDSLTLKETAKGDLYFDIKHYFDFDKDWKKEIDKIFEIRKEMEKRIKEGVKIER